MTNDIGGSRGLLRVMHERNDAINRATNAEAQLAGARAALEEQGLALDAAIASAKAAASRVKELELRIAVGIALVNAVKCSGLDGLYCEPVNGTNWFDKREEFLQLPPIPEGGAT